MSSISTESVSKYVPGLVIIINDDATREGSEADVKLLQDTFEKLGAKVIIWKYNDDKDEDEVPPSPMLKETKVDATQRKEVPHASEELKTKVLKMNIKKRKDKYKQKLEKLSDELKRCQYFVIAHCSHGAANGMIKGPEAAYNIRRLFLLPLFKIQSLEHKLKWLIVQACRGANETRVQQATTDGDGKYYNKYVLVSYSSSEGEESYRREGESSIYIEKLCAELNRSADQLDLETILEDTAEAVRQYFVVEQPEKLQQPSKSLENFCNHQFFFTDGLRKRTD